MKRETGRVERLWERVSSAGASRGQVGGVCGQRGLCLFTEARFVCLVNSWVSKLHTKKYVLTCFLKHMDLVVNFFLLLIKMAYSFVA